MAAFLELPFAPEMLTYHEGKTRHEPGLSAKKAWLPPLQAFGIGGNTPPLITYAPSHTLVPSEGSTSR